MDTCSHGFLDASSCPECSRMLSVKPKLLINNDKFIEMTFQREPAAENAPEIDQENREGDPTTIPVELLRPVRLERKEGLKFTIPDNSALLHARLNQITLLGTMEVPLPETIDERVREMRKRTLNPHVIH